MSDAAPKTVKGSISSPDGNGFDAVFMINDIQFTASGTFSPDVQPFNGSSVVLTYPDITDLSGSISFAGVIGIKSVSLVIGPNPDGTHSTIAGPLDSPVEPANRVVGEVTWKGN